MEATPPKASKTKTFVRVAATVGLAATMILIWTSAIGDTSTHTSYDGGGSGDNQGESGDEGFDYDKDEAELAMDQAEIRVMNNMTEGRQFL